MKWNFLNSLILHVSCSVEKKICFIQFSLKNRALILGASFLAHTVVCQKSNNNNSKQTNTHKEFIENIDSRNESMDLVKSLFHFTDCFYPLCFKVWLSYFLSMLSLYRIISFSEYAYLSKPAVYNRVCLSMYDLLADICVKG